MTATAATLATPTYTVHEGIPPPAKGGPGGNLPGEMMEIVPWSLLLT